VYHGLRRCALSPGRPNPAVSCGRREQSASRGGERSQSTISGRHVINVIYFVSGVALFPLRGNRRALVRSAVEQIPG
jgi:hypothetical protein